MANKIPEQHHLVAQASLRLVRKTEGGLTSFKGRLLQPASFNNDPINAWSILLVCEERLTLDSEAQVPVAIFLEDKAPTLSLLSPGNTFSAFFDGMTFGEGKIIETRLVTDEEFRRIFHIDDWPGFFTYEIND